jgi:hypothetical protein
MLVEKFSLHCAGLPNARGPWSDADGAQRDPGSFLAMVGTGRGHRTGRLRNYQYYRACAPCPPQVSDCFGIDDQVGGSAAGLGHRIEAIVASDPCRNLRDRTGFFLEQVTGVILHARNRE